MLFKNCCIAGPALFGLAVKTNISPLPNLPWRFLARSANGPSAVPSATFSKLLKSNSAPASVKLPASIANSAALISLTEPSGF